MEKRKEEDTEAHKQEGGTLPSAVVAAFFDERKQAEMALSDLERSGIAPDKLGFISPAKDRNQSAAKGTEKRRLFPGPATTGFPGWTMGMAPWTVSGAGPLVAGGSLSLVHRKSRPEDLQSLASSLGLRADAAEQMEQAFQRQSVLVTVEAPQKEIIATHILERNGGRALPRK